MVSSSSWYSGENSLLRLTRLLPVSPFLSTQMRCPYSLLLLSSLLLAAPAHSQSTATLLKGKWTCPISAGYAMVLELKPDGTGTLDGSPIRYQAAGGQLTVTELEDQAVNQYAYQLAGSSLTLSGGDLDGSLTFSRAGGGATGLGSRQRAASTSPAAKQAAPVSAGADRLRGTWSGPTGTFVFNAGGQGLANGNPMTYRTTGSTLTLNDGTSSYELAYVITGTTLALTGNGATVTFTKGGAGAGASSRAAAHPAGAGSRGQELVGKWCYLTSNYNSLGSSTNASSTEDCIIINADGTYQHHSSTERTAGGDGYYGGTASQDSDAGTWRYDGGATITVISQKYGQQTLSLEKRNHPKTGDPMVFLDGRGYVTYYQKASW